MNKKIPIIIFCFISLFIFFANVSSIYSAQSQNTTNFIFDKQGDSGSGMYSALLPDYNNFQAWQAHVYATVEGHGGFGPSGGKYGIDMCLSDNGMMWGGRPCWNIVDSNTGGNIGDGHSIADHYRDIGSNATLDLSYAVVGLYANDATFEAGSLVTVYGRQVSIDSFNTSSNNVNVTNQFDITWSTSEVSGDVVLNYSGPVTCDVGASPQTVPNNFGTTCTATGAGTATFTLQATGYGGRNNSRPKTISSAPINVNISAPGGNVTFNVTDACSGGNIGGNASINLNGVGTQVTTNAGAYNTTTFVGVPNGVRNWTSSVTGYNVAPGSVNVSGNTTVNVSQTRTCGGPTGDMTASNSSPNFLYTNSNGPLVIGYGDNSTTLSWVSNATACSVTSSPNVGTWSGISGTNVNVGVLTANTTFTMSCNNGVTDTVVVNIPPTPTGITATCPAPGNLATANWNTSGGYNTFYFRALPGVIGDIGGPYLSNSNENLVGTTGTVVTTAGNTYSIIVYARNSFNNAWSGPAYVNVTCPINNPTIDGVTISSPTVVPNGTNQYTISVTTSDAAGGASIPVIYALPNILGANAGAYRGWLTWGKLDYWPATKNHMACSPLPLNAGGFAGIQSAASGHPGYGDEYMNLISCSTSVSGNSRTANFVVSFNPQFLTDGPITNNDIGGYAENSAWQAPLGGWKNFPDLFSLDTGGPSTASLTANGSSSITVNAGDTVNYLWSSTNGVSWVTGLQIYNISTGNPVATDACGINSTNNFAPISSASGSLNGNIVGACQLGYRYEFTYAVTNSIGQTTQSILNISVQAGASIPVVGSPTAVSITSTGATLGGSVTSLGIPASISARGTCWGTTALPVTNCVAASGTTLGAFSHARAGLSPNTLYYYRAYATNPTGTGYSADGTFTTSAAAQNGVCGSKAGGPALSTRNYPAGTVAWSGGDTECSIGTAPAQTFPTPGSPATWQCAGVNGGNPSGMCTATVSAATYSVNVTVTTASGGVVSSVPAGINNCTGTCSSTFAQNSTVTLIATPSSSYWRFAGWGITGGGPAGDCSGTTNCVLNIDGPKTATATFSPRLFKYIEF